MTPDARRKVSPADKAAQHQREAQWLRQIAAGGRAAAARAAAAALDRLVGAYEDWMLRFCIGHQHLPQAEAEDLVQELWVRVIKSAAGFRADGNPESWLFAILRHLVADLQRDNWRHLRNDLVDNDQHEAALALLSKNHVPGPDAASAQALDDCVADKLKIVETLYPGDPEALRLRHLHDWAVRGLAEPLGHTYDGMRSFLHAVRLKFRPHFQPCFDLLST